MTRRKGALRAGAALLALLCAGALAGPLLTPWDPREMDQEQVLAAPSWRHPAGTDSLGRDVASRLLHGARRSLGVALVATVVAVALGVSLGAAAGISRTGVDAALSRLCDLVYAFPPIVAAISVLGLKAGPVALVPPVARLGLFAGLFGWPVVFRLVRGDLRRMRHGELAVAARAAGAGPWRVSVIHLAPQALAPILAPASFLAAGAVLFEAGLSLLGLGIQPPTPSWGALLMDGMNNIRAAWWLSAFPGACVFATVLGCQLVGEGLLDE